MNSLLRAHARADPRRGISALYLGFLLYRSWLLGFGFSVETFLAYDRYENKPGFGVRGGGVCMGLGIAVLCDGGGFENKQAYGVRERGVCMAHTMGLGLAVI